MRLSKLLAPSMWITLPSQAYGLSERVKKQWRAHALLAPFIFTFAFTAVVSLPLNAQTVSVENQNQKDPVKSGAQEQEASANDEWDSVWPGDDNVESGDDWNDEWDDEWGTESKSKLRISGFAELAVGNRFFRDMATAFGSQHSQMSEIFQAVNAPSVLNNSTLRDARVQLRADYALDSSSISSKADVWYNGVTSSWESQLRELAWQGSLSSILPSALIGKGNWASAFDIKVGKQVLTWGTGDYLFLNDLFPKDYQSFFAGREDEYLKAPSNALKVSGYTDFANVDLVVTPEFEPDIGITGEIFSFYSPQLDENIAPSFSVERDNRPRGSELALRVYKSVKGMEIAGYGYTGYTRQPTATDSLGRPRYSKMNAYGASVVAPLGRGIANAEYVFYNSLEDMDGSDGQIANDQSRFLLGYSQEIAANLTGGFQWYTEYLHNADGLNRTVSSSERVQEKYRHWVTTRLTWLALRQTLTLNTFLFYSPSDSDGYLKTTVAYSPTDKWQVRAGVNVFSGKDNYTFWGQFEDASNAFIAYRFYF